MVDNEARGFVDTRLAGRKIVVFTKRYCHHSRRCQNLLWNHIPGDITHDDIDWIEIQDRNDYKSIQEYLKTLTGSGSVCTKLMYLQNTCMC